VVSAEVTVAAERTHQQDRAALSTGRLPSSHFFPILEEMPDRPLLRETELIIMLAVLRLEPKAYGVPLSREIRRCSGVDVPMATMYATLERLEERGFVSAKMGEPTAERGGRAKKYFRVTAIGLRAVREMQKSLMKLWEGLPQLEGGVV
jgi:PadR family transcriptional regulator, regulatory protein PadR